MTRLSKEEYREAVGLLKKYNYNCLNIINMRADIIGINIPQNDGMPRAPYNISDTVYKKYIELEENENLQKSLKEYKIVIQALELVDKDSKYIFEEFFQKGKMKWDIMSKKGMSARTFERRKRELIYAVHKEIKKSGENLAKF